MGPVSHKNPELERAHVLPILLPMVHGRSRVAGSRRPPAVFTRRAERRSRVPPPPAPLRTTTRVRSCRAGAADKLLGEPDGISHSW